MLSNYSYSTAIPAVDSHQPHCSSHYRSTTPAIKSRAAKMPAAPLVPKPQAQRYRRGKLPNGAPIPSDESSDDEEEQQQQPIRAARRTYADDEREGIVAGGAGKIIRPGNDLVSSVKAASGAGKKGIQVALRDVKVEDDGALLIGGKREVGRTEMEGEINPWHRREAGR